MAFLLSGCGLVNLDYAALALLSIALPRASQRAKFAGKGPETGKNDGGAWLSISLFGAVPSRPVCLILPPTISISLRKSRHQRVRLARSRPGEWIKIKVPPLSLILGRLRPSRSGQPPLLRSTGQYDRPGDFFKIPFRGRGQIPPG